MITFTDSRVDAVCFDLAMHSLIDVIVVLIV
jgi:hypothetical protein